MSGAARSLALIALGLLGAACGETPQDGAANNAAAMDIEALPPDESVDEPLNNAGEPANAQGLAEGEVAG